MRDSALRLAGLPVLVLWRRLAGGCPDARSDRKVAAAAKRRARRRGWVLSVQDRGLTAGTMGSWRGTPRLPTMRKRRTSCSSERASSRPSMNAWDRSGAGRRGASCSSAARRAWGRRRCCGGFAKRAGHRCGSSGVAVIRSFTPRPLGPLLAVAEAAGGELEEVVASGVLPHEVVAALSRELRARAPTVFVLEDVHWADEATLDVLRLLVRRIETVPALIVVSYRDDELARAHPLRIVLGELAIEPGGWTAEARCALAGGGRAAGRAVWRRCGRAVPQDRRQSVLRRRGARRGRR